MLVIVDAQDGDSTTAHARLVSVLQRYPPDSLQVATMLVSLAAASIAVGDFYRGLALLERVPPSRLWLSIRNPLWDTVRQDPRFRHLETEARALQPTVEGRD